MDTFKPDIDKQEAFLQMDTFMEIPPMGRALRSPRRRLRAPPRLYEEGLAPTAGTATPPVITSAIGERTEERSPKR